MFQLHATNFIAYVMKKSINLLDSECNGRLWQIRYDLRPALYVKLPEIPSCGEVIPVILDED